MSSFDPLREVELLAIVEEASAPLNHDVRNRIATLRNLAFFVRRKLTAELNANRDPRVLQFLGKIESEVQRTDECIDAWSARVQGVRSRAAEPVLVLDCLRLAIAAARFPSAVSLELGAPSAEALALDVDLGALAFALRCLIENAAEAAPVGVVHVSAERCGALCRLTVRDWGPGIVDPPHCLEPFVSSKPGHLGLGLSMARRMAARFAGELVIGNPEVGAEVSLLLPLATPPNP